MKENNYICDHAESCHNDLCRCRKPISYNRMFHDSLFQNPNGWGCSHYFGIPVDYSKTVVVCAIVAEQESEETKS